MILFVVLILAYVFSVYGAYKFFQASYSAGGQWSHIHATIEDLIFVVLPIFNFVFTCIWAFGGAKSDGGLNLNRLFKVKK